MAYVLQEEYQKNIKKNIRGDVGMEAAYLILVL